MSLAVIRCDARPRTGIGHLARGLSVGLCAQARGWEVVVAGDVSSDLGRDLLARAGFDVVEPAGRSLARLAAEVGAGVVHVDDYETGRDAWTDLARSGALLSSMEDGQFGRRRADVVVDSTIGAQDLARPDDGSGRFLAGIRYAPMRPDVLVARARRAGATNPGDGGCLVVMGGTDAVGAAPIVARVCALARGLGRVTVIAPRERWTAVRAAAPQAELLEPFDGFLATAADAAVVISAAGTSAWELACIGVPTVLVPVVANQLAGYRAALARGIAWGLGTPAELADDPAAAARRLDAILADIATGARPPGPRGGTDEVDGRGAERIVEAWESDLAARLDAGGDLRARPAAEEDAFVLLRWRNDPAVRAVSRSTGLVAWRDHLTWLRAVLGDVNRTLVVVTAGDRPVGTARFDQNGPAQWEVSITLAPEARGRGLAGPVLATAEADFSRVRGAATLLAAVLPENLPSQRLFARAGYRSTGRRDGAFDLLAKPLAAGADRPGRG